MLSYREEVVSIEMDEPLKKAYEDLEEDIKKQKGLPSGYVEGGDEPRANAQGKDMPDGDRAGQGQHGKDQGLAHGQALREENGPVQVPAVGEYACHGGQEETGNLAAKAHQPQQERRVCQAVDEPDHGHLLHPSANQEAALPEKKSRRLRRFKAPSKVRFL